MSLDKANANLKFDSRMAEINMRFGSLTKEEHQKHLQQLPDLSAQAEKLNLDDSNSEAKDEESH